MVCLSLYNHLCGLYIPAHTFHTLLWFVFVYVFISWYVTNCTTIVVIYVCIHLCVYTLVDQILLWYILNVYDGSTDVTPVKHYIMINTCIYFGTYIENHWFDSDVCKYTDITDKNVHNCSKIGSHPHPIRSSWFGNLASLKAYQDLEHPISSPGG